MKLIIYKCSITSWDEDNLIDHVHVANFMGKMQQIWPKLHEQDVVEKNNVVLNACSNNANVKIQ